MYQTNSGSLFAMLLISFAITLFAYGAFPLIWAKNRTEAITKKKYNLTCWGVNFLISLLFGMINGTASGAPYVLWTLVFTNSGLKKLKSKGLLVE